MLKKAIFQVSILAGTIIGAGVFALPFVFDSAGIGAGFFYLALAFIALSVVYLMYADIVMRTKEQHRFLGYSAIYLGQRSFWPVLLMTIVETIFVLAIYLVLSKSFSRLIGVPSGDLEAVLFFWFISSLSIFLGLRRFAFLEMAATGGIIVIIGLIFFWGFDSLDTIDFGGLIGNWRTFLLPLGPVLFALSGRVAIPTLVKYWPEKSAVRNSIIFGILIPVVIYSLFVLSILGLSVNVSEDAVTGLVGQVPSLIIILISVFGLLAIWTSYIAVGFDIYESLLQDLRFSRWTAPLVITFAPLLIYFSSSQSFITLVSFVGGIFLALESLLIIVMWLRANRIATQPPVLLSKKNFLAIGAVAGVFVVALIYEIIK